ncbi:TAXI family TRAP transporter solute-binding subunit [Mesobacterium pallidum]|uniref:TAXI family TRAP transporter solute-binding subunit n=1 Tax=Mesobacterium pallidum TaxID=2872037 RepID=UPI001EE1B28B|nr:TAXI family TRAP transporter solute-binding subunit [Mesobacterium pallidum]
MNRTCSTAIATLVALCATTASAQLVTLSTTSPGGLAHSVGSAIAKTVSQTTDLRMVVVPAGGSPMPAVAGGEAECGINIAFDLAYFVNGDAYYNSDGAHPNLRMVAAVLPSQLAIYVRKDSEVETVADLKGKRVPSELNAQLAIGAVYETFLALGGLTRDDVTSIPAQSIVQAADDFSTGRNDTFAFSIGTAKVLEVDSSVGGLKALQIDATDANSEALNRNLPGAYFSLVEPNEKAPQIVAPTNVITFDIVMFCADTVPEDTVATITKAVYANKDMLADTYKAMSRFDPSKMAPKVPGVAYHPGAETAYGEIGLGTPEG